MQKIHHTKKSLGQNFLKSEPALRKIIEAGEISPDDIILEIGPGKGVLTKKLLEKSSHVVAVEKDKNLVEFLQEKFSEEIKSKKLILLEEDILNFDVSYVGNTFSQVLGSPRPKSEGLGQTVRKSIPDFASQNVKQNILERTLGRSGDDGQRKFSAENFRGESKNVLRNYKIIANIPYNITGAILKKFLTEKNQPTMMVLMVQNEVAKRILGNRTNPTSQKLRGARESILSISVKAYGTPKMEMKVPARYFSPAPKVDSAIISIKNISRKNFPPLLDKERAGVRFFNPPPPNLPLIKEEGNTFEERFWEIIHAGFAHKRKKLANNLKHYIGSSYVNSLGNYGNMRAEDLTLVDWINIVKML